MPTACHGSRVICAPGIGLDGLGEPVLDVLELNGLRTRA